jgi:hypothetical protein
LEFEWKWHFYIIGKGFEISLFPGLFWPTPPPGSLFLFNFREVLMATDIIALDLIFFAFSSPAIVTSEVTIHVKAFLLSYQETKVSDDLNFKA